MDPTRLSITEKARLIRAYVNKLYLHKALGHKIDSGAPDIGTDDSNMAVHMDETVRLWSQEQKNITIVLEEVTTTRPCGASCYRLC